MFRMRMILKSNLSLWYHSKYSKLLVLTSFLSL